MGKARISMPATLFSMVCSVFALTGATGSPETVKIPDGTVVQVVLTQALSSANNHQNDAVHFEVADDIRVGGVLVIAKGAPAVGHISEAEPKGRWGHSGKLSYSVDYAKAVDGSNVRLRASASQGGQDSKAALMLGLSGAFKHGKDAKVAKGATMSAYVDGDNAVSVSATPAPGAR